MRLFLLISCVFLLLNCGGKTTVKHSYSDGSGNTYHLKAEKNRYQIEYLPISRETSSSGIYDGGRLIKKEISKEIYQKVVALLQKAIARKESQMKERIKTSGFIRFEEPQRNIIIILKPDCQEKQEIENLLKAIIK